MAAGWWPTAAPPTSSPMPPSSNSTDCTDESTEDAGAGPLLLLRPQALLEIGFQDADVALVPADGPLQGVQQALGGVEAHHESLVELDGFRGTARQYLLCVQAE